MESMGRPGRYAMHKQELLADSMVLLVRFPHLVSNRPAPSVMRQVSIAERGLPSLFERRQPTRGSGMSQRESVVTGSW